MSYLGSEGAPTVVFPVAADVHGRGFCAEGGEAESDPSEGRQQYNVLPPPVDEDEERTISRLEATLKQCQLGAAPAPPVHDGGVFLSHPAPGKHLAFDGRLLHGALHELAAGSWGVNTNADNGEPPPRITLLVCCPARPSHRLDPTGLRPPPPPQRHPAVLV